MERKSAANVMVVPEETIVTIVPTAEAADTINEATEIGKEKILSIYLILRVC